MILALVIATLILIVAIVIAQFAAEVVEEEHTFLKIVGIFLLLYVIAAVIIVYLFKSGRVTGFPSVAPQTVVSDGSDNTYGYR